MDHYAAFRSSRPSVVLTMIVRDEAHVLERCLRSVRPMIDAWCVVDTGSTDGTPALARRLLADLPGRLVEVPWRDFAYNRTEALRLGQDLGDYHFVVDADAVCVIDTDDVEALRRAWNADVYGVVEHLGDVRNVRPIVLSTRQRFSYRGVTHETLVLPDGAVRGEILEGIHLVAHTDGARSRNQRKFLDDAELIERALDRNDEPDLRSRYVFYLAQAYRNAGVLPAALSRYRERVALGGRDQEVYVSLLCAGQLAAVLHQPSAEVLDTFLRAIDLMPERAEAYFYAAAAARRAGRMPTAFLLAQAGLRARPPRRAMFQDVRATTWGLLLELSLAAHGCGRLAEATSVSVALARRTDLPADVRGVVEANIAAWTSAMARGVSA